MYVNVGGIDLRLNGEPLQEVIILSTCVSMAADGGCERDVVHRMNERQL